MALEVKPNEIVFGSVEDYGKVEITLTNTYSNAVTYRFRLQSDSVLFENAKDTVEKGQSKILKVTYNPEKNKSKAVIMNVQLKYSELQNGKEGKEHAMLIPIRFSLDAKEEDHSFITQDVSEPPREPGGWWKIPDEDD